MVSGKPSDSVCVRNACSHLVPAMKQDIASTEYGVIPAAVRSSPGTKMLTRAVSSGFARALIIFWKRLSQSKFRSSFSLKANDRSYVSEKGMEKVREHACDFIRKRLAPAEIPNDGKQTPMRGHPVFVAQHATATCSRGCLEKWHRIPKGRELTETEQEYIVNVIMEWIGREIH